MGTKNRERRKAKQKARQQQQRRREQQQWWSGDGWAPPWRDPVQPVPPEDADSLLSNAVHVRQCPDHDESELPECLDALAARSDETDRAVMSWLQGAITRCWRCGWQPADLVRAASRSTGARQARMVKDAIAAEMRRYASATVDERWAAQLTELEATAWWERDDHYLDAWGARERLPRVNVLGCAVEVLALFEQLPVLPRLAPLPGTARPRAAATGETLADQRILDRVRALLAKAESTTFPEEAEAYSAKAQELMARHSIDHALLAAGASARDEPAGRRLGVDNPYEHPKALLLECVASANRCRSVWDKQYGFSTVMGFPNDLDAVELLYTSLLVQATTAMLHEGSRRDHAGRSRTRAFRQSFLTAYATRIGQRLRTATDEATREAAAGTDRADLLPVLAAREHEVDEAVEQMFPGIVAQRVRATDLEGWASGMAAADRASLGVRDQVTGASHS